MKPIKQVETNWRQSIFVCAHERDPTLDRVYCGASEGSELRQWLKDRLRKENLRSEIIAVKTGCLGICSSFGVTIAVIPEGGTRELFVFNPDGDREVLWEKVVGILR